MHLYFYLRGLPQFIAMAEAFLESQFFKWRRINLKTKQEEIILVQGALRRSIFGAYEYVFPEEALEEVINMMGINQDKIGAENNLTNKLRLFSLRKLFGSKKIPKVKQLEMSRYFKEIERGLSSLKVFPVSIHPIGIKKDVRKKDKNLGYEQEML